MISQEKSIKVNNSNWPQTFDHWYIILIIESFGSGKTNTLLNLVSNQPDIDKIYLYAKNIYEAKYQLLIDKHEGVSVKHCNDFKAFIEYSNGTDDIYENIEEYNR